MLTIKINNTSSDFKTYSKAIQADGENADITRATTTLVLPTQEPQTYLKETCKSFYDILCNKLGWTEEEYLQLCPGRVEPYIQSFSADIIMHQIQEMDSASMQYTSTACNLQILEPSPTKDSLKIHVIHIHPPTGDPDKLEQAKKDTRLKAIEKNEEVLNAWANGSLHTYLANNFDLTSTFTIEVTREGYTLQQTSNLIRPNVPALALQYLSIFAKHFETILTLQHPDAAKHFGVENID
jgi:hypothetical protein